MSNITPLKKPPLGLRPKFIVAQSRVQEIDEAIKRYEDDGTIVPLAWTAERREIIKYLAEVSPDSLQIKPNQ